MRFFYPLPALPRNGGIKVCIQHSHILNEQGIEVYVTTPTPCANPYPRYTHARFMTEDDCLQSVQSEDVFVFSWAESIRPFFHLDNRFVFFSQGVINTTDPVPHSVWLNERFELMTLGRHSHDFFFYGYGKKSDVVSNWIDTTLFHPGENRQSSRIGMISHRDYNDPELVSQIEGAGFNVVSMSGDEEEIARGMQTCDYFVSTAKGVFNGHDHAEGFALPCAEAMACGALVVCYNNHGVLSYAQDRVNCRISWNNSPAEVGSMLTELNTSPEREQVRQNGVFTIQRGFNKAVIWNQLQQALRL